MALPAAATIVQTASGAATLVKNAPTMTPGTYVLMMILIVLIIGILGLARIWVKTKPQLQTIADKRRKDDIDLMSERITLLEGKIDDERARCDADLRVMRHRTNNVMMCFDALLLLIETAPEKASEHVVKIKEMRARQASDEATEKGHVMAAKIAGGVPA